MKQLPITWKSAIYIKIYLFVCTYVRMYVCTYVHTYPCPSASPNRSVPLKGTPAMWACADGSASQFLSQILHLAAALNAMDLMNIWKESSPASAAKAAAKGNFLNFIFQVLRDIYLSCSEVRSPNKCCSCKAGTCHLSSHCQSTSFDSLLWACSAHLSPESS